MNIKEKCESPRVQFLQRQVERTTAIWMRDHKRDTLADSLRANRLHRRVLLAETLLLRALGMKRGVRESLRGVHILTNLISEVQQLIEINGPHCDSEEASYEASCRQLDI